MANTLISPRSRLSKLGRTVGSPCYPPSCSQVADGLEHSSPSVSAIRL